MEMQCVFCPIIVVDPENDIRTQEIEAIPVYLVIDVLFRLRIDADERSRKSLPYRICPGCMKDLTTAHKLRCQLWRKQELVTQWENIHEEKSDDNEILAKDPNNGIKEEIIMDSESDKSISSNSPSQDTEFVPTDSQSLPFSFSTSVSESIKHEPNLGQHLPSEPKIDRPHECNLCYKKFYTSAALKEHEAIHVKDNLPYCHICQKTIKRKGNLKIHLHGFHGQATPYECEICHKRFKLPANLRIHQSAHTEGKKYTCEICLKSFKWKKGLTSHKQIYHKNLNS